jgi:hypothetical protein
MRIWMCGCKRLRALDEVTAARVGVGIDEEDLGS